MRVDEKTFLVNSMMSLAAFLRIAAALFSQYKHVTFSWRVGSDRTIFQNSKLWPMLTDISRQVVWYGKTYKQAEWKDILTGSLRNAEFVPNTEGTGFVALGLRTSTMSRKEFSELIEFIYAFGAAKDVRWSEKSKTAYQEYQEAA